MIRSVKTFVNHDNHYTVFHAVPFVSDSKKVQFLLTHSGILIDLATQSIVKLRPSYSRMCFACGTTSVYHRLIPIGDDCGKAAIARSG
jgi:hypothetical protein